MDAFRCYQSCAAASLQQLASMEGIWEHSLRIGQQLLAVCLCLRLCGLSDPGSEGVRAFARLTLTFARLEVVHLWHAVGAVVDVWKIDACRWGGGQFGLQCYALTLQAATVLASLTATGLTFASSVHDLYQPFAIVFHLLVDVC